MVEERNCDTIAKLLNYKITKLNSYKKRSDYKFW